MEKDELKTVLTEELAAFKAAMPDYVSPEDLDKRLGDFEVKLTELNMKDELAELKDAVEKQGLEMLKYNTKQSEGKSLLKVLEEKQDELKNASVQNPVKFTINKADILTSSVADSTLAMRLGDVGQIQTPFNSLRPLFATGSVSPGMGGTVRYIDQAVSTNNALPQTEGGLKEEGVLNWIEKPMPLEVIAEWLPVSKQALRDFSFIESEIRNKLVSDIGYTVDGQLWAGTGAAPNLTGIYTYADTFVPVASGITDASIYDLIVKVHESITATTKYQPNYAVMNIADVNNMRLKKDANNNYVLPPFVSVDGTMVAGMTIIASAHVTANTMLVGDFTRATLYNIGGIDITIGWHSDQFIKNMVTILAEETLGLLVRSVDTGAFNKVTDIDAALVTLAT